MAANRYQATRCFRYSSTASAARWPLIAALSIVAGRPVLIQSPARNRPGTEVTVRGRPGCPGATEKVARFSRTTIERAIATMEKGLDWPDDFKMPTRDEMHER